MLTEDLKFLDEADRSAVKAGQRRVVAGMMNWTFTWLREGGALTHASLAPRVVQLFLGGLPAVQMR